VRDTIRGEGFNERLRGPHLLRLGHRLAPVAEISSDEMVCLFEAQHITIPVKQGKTHFFVTSVVSRLPEWITQRHEDMNTSSRVLSLSAESAEIASETSSTLKAFGVLEVLVRAGRAVTLSELMQATELPKPTLHRALALFEEAGFSPASPAVAPISSVNACRALPSTFCAVMAPQPSAARYCGASSVRSPKPATRGAEERRPRLP